MMADEGSMAEYYDDRDDICMSKIDIIRELLAQHNREKTIVHTSHLIYQNKLMKAGHDTATRIKLAIAMYDINAMKKVGETCCCPSCGKEFVKNSYQQKFCKSKVRCKSNCKDFYHNFVSESRNKRTKTMQINKSYRDDSDDARL